MCAFACVYVCACDTRKWHLGHGELKFGPTGRGFDEFFGHYNAGADHWEHIAW